MGFSLACDFGIPPNAAVRLVYDGVVHLPLTPPSRRPARDSLRAGTGFGMASRRLLRLRLLAALVVCLLCVGLVWGLAGALATSSTPPPAGKVVLKIGMTNMLPTTSTPSSGRCQSSYEIWSLDYDLLVGFSPGDYSHPQGAAATGLADHWTVSDGGRVWTFHIRSGVKWQDGVPLTAARRRLHLQLRHQEPARNYTTYTTVIEERDRPPTTTPSCSPPAGPRPTCSDCGSTSCRSTSGARLAASRRPATTQQLAADRGQRPLPGHPVQERQLRHR